MGLANAIRNCAGPVGFGRRRGRRVEAGMAYHGSHGVHDDTARRRFEGARHAGTLEQRTHPRQCPPRIAHRVAGGLAAGGVGAPFAAVESAFGFGGGGRGVVKLRSLGCRRPLRARTPVAMSRKRVFVGSGCGSMSNTTVYGGGSDGFCGGGGILAFAALGAISHTSGSVLTASESARRVVLESRR